MKNNDYLSLKNVFILSVAASPLLITIYFLIYISSAKMAEYSNLVISIATVFATLIHYSSTKQQQIERRFEAEKQRKDRLWDINKDILLDLLDAVTKVIDACNYELEKRNLSSSGNGTFIDELGEPPADDVYRKFKDKLDFTLRVYKPLMNTMLVEECETLINTDFALKRAVEEMEMEVDEAIEEITRSYEKVLYELQEFILDISGVAEMTLKSNSNKP